MRRYIITASQAAARPHTNFLRAIKDYAMTHRADLIVLPMIGEDAKQDLDMQHPLTKMLPLEYGTRKLNSNVSIEQFHVRPQQVDPATGLMRFAQQGTSLIFASPKQRLRAIPHSNHKLPKFLITTGALTIPNYATERHNSAERRRLGEIARRDHVYGAVILEVVDDNQYHFRHVRANTQGEFVDLGTRYTGRGEMKPSRLEALVLGDWHNGRNITAPSTASKEQIVTYKPRKLILHDFFDGHSVSHHMRKELIRQMIREGVDLGHTNLEQELQEGYDQLMEFNELMDGRPIYLVASNHHEFLDRYLDEGRFVKDPENARLAFKIGVAYTDGHDPVEWGINHVGGRLPRNIRFLRREEDLKVRGYQLGSHTDKGANGGRATGRSVENDWGRAIGGHRHSAEIMRNTYTVGTHLPLVPYYMVGQPSKFTHTNAFVWNNGTVQLVHTLPDGSWRA